MLQVPTIQHEAAILFAGSPDIDLMDGETETLPEADQYELQGTAFSRAVRGEIALPFGVDDAIANMRVIDALFRSEKTGTWEAV